MSGFWQTTGKSKFQPQAFPWKTLCQRSVSVSRSTAAFTVFFTGTEVLSCSRILHYSESHVLQCIYASVRTFIDVVPRGQPSLGTVCTPTAQPSHSRGKHSAKWHPEGGLRSIIPDLQSWQCSFTTPPCDAAVSHSFSFSVQRTIVDGHRLHGGFSDKYLLEHLMPQNKTRFPSPSCCECFGCLQPCQTGYVSAHFVQNTLESNTDTNTKLPSSLLPSCILRGYSRGTAKGKKV